MYISANSAPGRAAYTASEDPRDIRYVCVYSEYIRVYSEYIRVYSEYIRVYSEYIRVYSEYLAHVVAYTASQDTREIRYTHIYNAYKLIYMYTYTCNFYAWKGCLNRERRRARYSLYIYIYIYM